MVSSAALVLSSAVGALLTAGQLSGDRLPAFLCRVYVEFVRGTPLLAQILVGYYLVADAIGWDSRIGVGIVVLSCFSGKSWMMSRSVFVRRRINGCARDRKVCSDAVSPYRSIGVAKRFWKKARDPR